MNKSVEITQQGKSPYGVDTGESRVVKTSQDDAVQGPVPRVYFCVKYIVCTVCTSDEVKKKYCEG